MYNIKNAVLYCKSQTWTCWKLNTCCAYLHNILLQSVQVITCVELSVSLHCYFLNTLYKGLHFVEAYIRALTSCHLSTLCSSWFLKLIGLFSGSPLSNFPTHFYKQPTHIPFDSLIPWRWLQWISPKCL